MADIPAQPCRRNRGDRPLPGADESDRGCWEERCDEVFIGWLAWLTIFVPSTVYAQNTVPEDEKGPSHVKDKPLQEQPNALPTDKMNEPGPNSTGQGEIDSNDTRPRTRDDVIREILNSKK